MEQLCNDPSTTLSLTIDGLITTVIVAVAAGFPTSGNFRIRINNELLLVTAVSGTTWTVTRGIENTTPAPHHVGAPVNAYLTSGGLAQFVSDTIAASIVIGTRANLPGTIPASGNLYRCTDSPYEYISNGSGWQAFAHGLPVVEPFGLTAVHSPLGVITPRTTYGGYQPTIAGGSQGTGGYMLPVTPSSTLAVVVGFSWQGGQVGPAIYNANTGNAIMFRYAAGAFYYSRYSISGDSLTSNVNNVAVSWGHWPTTCFLLTFNGSSWFLNVTGDTWNGTTSTGIYSEALSSFIGTNYTHVGFFVNGANSAFFLHCRQVSA